MSGPTPLVSDKVYTSIGFTFSILFVLALTENVLVIIVYLTTKSLRTKMNYWISSVILCDLLIVLNAFPFVIFSSFSKEYIFGVTGCKWDGFIVTWLGTSSIFLLTGLSVHRYIIMLTNIRNKNIKKTTVLLTVVFCFVMGLFWGIAPLIGWGSYDLEGINISCAPNWRSRLSWDVSYTIAMYIIVLFIPLIIMGFCYMSIILKVSTDFNSLSKTPFIATYITDTWHSVVCMYSGSFQRNFTIIDSLDHSSLKVYIYKHIEPTQLRDNNIYRTKLLF